MPLIVTLPLDSHATLDIMRAGHRTSEALEPESSGLISDTPEIPKQYNRLRKSKEQVDKAAKLIASGVKIAPALREAGWSPQAAQRGMKAITGPLQRALLKQGANLQELGRQALADPKEAEAVIMGRLMMNTLTGKDDGVQSVKTLGSHRAINCFTPDVQLGVQVNIGTLDALDDDSLITTPKP